MGGCIEDNKNSDKVFTFSPFIFNYIPVCTHMSLQYCLYYCQSSLFSEWSGLEQAVDPSQSLPPSHHPPLQEHHPLASGTPHTSSREQHLHGEKSVYIIYAPEAFASEGSMRLPFSEQTTERVYDLSVWVCGCTCV